MKEIKFEHNFSDELFDIKEDELVIPVYTIPNNEHRFYDYCQSNGIVSYLPLRKVWKQVRQIHGGKTYNYPKQVLRPMFPNYVFARLNPEQRSQVFRSNVIIRLLPVFPSSLEHLIKEIKTVHQIELINMDEDLEFNAEIKEGDKFVIESGPWQGIQGWLKKKEKKYLWNVEIECVGGLVTATIDPMKYKMMRID